MAYIRYDLRRDDYMASISYDLRRDVVLVMFSLWN